MVKKLAKFSLATNETYKNASGKKVTNTDLHNLIAWKKTVDIAKQYLEKERKNYY